MRGLLIHLGDPATREGLGAALCLVALLGVALRLRRGFRPGTLLLGLGVLFLLLSFVLAGAALVIREPGAAFLDPARPLHAALVSGFRLAGLPILLGAALLAGGARRRRAAAPAPAVQAPAPAPARTRAEVAQLTDRLAEARRDLDAVREELSQRGLEADRVSSKLRETLNLLLSSEERFRRIFEGANDGFVIADLATLAVSQANPRMAEMMGCPAHELTGRHLGEIFGPEIGERTEQELRVLSRAGAKAPTVALRRAGEEIRVALSLSIIDVGEEPMILVVARDVSESERLLASLESANRDLEEANRRATARAERLDLLNEKLLELQRVKDDFLSSVSHELRTPLTSIRSFSEILLVYDDADEDVKREFLSIINKESERLTRLINDLLDLARIEAGRMNLSRKPVDLRGLVRDVTLSLSPLAAERDQTVETALDPDLPPAEGDRDRLQQVLTNLLSNAVKFGGEGSRITIGGGRAADGMIEMWVRDRGPGIPPGEAEHIFEKFRRGGDTRGESHDGTGLGLAICREIVQLHGGRVWVESEPGEGAVFHFTLREASGAAPPAETGVPASSGAEPGAPPEPAPAAEPESRPEPLYAGSRLPPIPLRKDLSRSPPPLRPPEEILPRDA